MQRTVVILGTCLFLMACQQKGQTGGVPTVSTHPVTAENPGSTQSAATPALPSMVPPPAAPPLSLATPVPSPTPYFTPSPVSASTPCGASSLTFSVKREITRSSLGLTEGFYFDQGKLYESTGKISGHGPSVINSINLETGKVTKLISTPGSHFGEGLVRVGGFLYQLTYTEGNIHKYVSDGSPAGTKLVGTYPNPLSEGWGLTTDGVDLIASDGSDFIYRIDPLSLKIKSKIQVRDPSGQGITRLNELEFVGGQIYANLFPSDKMIRFDATSGCQTASIDLSSLWNAVDCNESPLTCDNDSVINGVAFDKSSGNFYLTGKSWPLIFVGEFR